MADNNVRISKRVLGILLNSIGAGVVPRSGLEYIAIGRNDELAALAEQLAFCPGQGQYPNAYWTLTEAFGTDINSGMYDTAHGAGLAVLYPAFIKFIYKIFFIINVFH